MPSFLNLVCWPPKSKFQLLLHTPIPDTFHDPVFFWLEISPPEHFVLNFKSQAHCATLRLSTQLSNYRRPRTRVPSAGVYNPSHTDDLANRKYFVIIIVLWKTVYRMQSLHKRCVCVYITNVTRKRNNFDLWKTAEQLKQSLGLKSSQEIGLDTTWAGELSEVSVYKTK